MYMHIYTYIIHTYNSYIYTNKIFSLFSWDFCPIFFFHSNLAVPEPTLDHCHRVLIIP